MAAAATPWAEHRMLAETIGQAVADSITHRIGSHVELGVASACDPEALLERRPMPVRAIVVRYGRPLRDVMVFLASLKEDAIRPLVEAAAEATIAALDIPTGSDTHGGIGQYTIDDAVEFEDLETALEQCDALFLEATYGLNLPTGELRMVIGTGLLESAAALAQGVADEYAVEPLCELPKSSALELGDDIAASAVAVHELGSDGAGTSGAGDTLDTGAPAGSPLDLLDAELAAQEHVAIAAAPSAGSAIESTTSGAEAHHQSALQWTQLLSGVEVELSAELGRADLALSEITSLDADVVLTLDQMVDQPVSVFVNGTRFATARLVVVDGEYGIEIVEIVDQLALETALAA